MQNLLTQLKERRIWRVLIAYPSVAFVLLQAVEFFINNYDLDARYLTASLIASLVLFPAAVVWNWRHGEVGHQQVSRGEVGAYVVSAVAALAAVGWYWSATPADSRIAIQDLDPVRSIAVMPFANTGDNVDAQYLCDGIAESLINWLATVEDVRVVSKGAAFRLREYLHDTDRVAEELGVDSVLTGELQIVGDQVHVSANLVDVRDQSQVWGARLVQSAGDVLNVERVIVSAIRDGLSLNMAEDASADRRSGDTDNPEAYKRYLRGHYLIQSTNPESINAGIDELRAAIRLDPGFGKPYADIADSLSQLLSYGLLQGDELLGEARNAAYTAIALAPDLPEAHTALATIHQYFDFDWDAADKAYETAIALPANSTAPFHRYTDYLVLTHRFERAQEMAARAVAIDAVDSSALHAVGLAFLIAGDFDEAAEAFGEWNRFYPGSGWSNIKYALALSLAGRCDEAASRAAKADAIYGGQPPSLQESWLAWSYKVCGAEVLYERSIERVNAAQLRNPNPYDPGLAYILALQGNEEEFVELFEQIVVEGIPFVLFAKLFTIDYLGFDITTRLAGNERFQLLIDELGFPATE